MRNFKNIALILTITSLIFAGCSQGPIVEELKVEDNKFFFTLTGTDGAKMRFEDLRGKGVVINVWATWCGPCLNELPVINDLFNKYKDQGLEVWGIATDIQGESVVTPKLQELGINYTNFVYQEAELVKIFDYLRGRPTTFFFDATGEIVKRVDGEPFVDKEQGETLESWWEENIKAVLPEK